VRRRRRWVKPPPVLEKRMELFNFSGKKKK